MKVAGEPTQAFGLVESKETPPAVLPAELERQERGMADPQAVKDRISNFIMSCSVAFRIRPDPQSMQFFLVMHGHALLTAHFLVLEFATTASKIKRSNFMSFRQIYIHTWNPNDPCIGWKRPCHGGLILKNRGHLGSRYILLSFQISAGRHPVFHNH